MFIEVLFIIAKTWKQPKCPWMDEWTKKICIYMYVYIYTYIYIYILYIYCRILFSYSKGGNLAICDNMDRTRWHYAK